MLLKMSIVREVFENLNSDLDTFHVTEQMINADENIINFLNGILKLDTMELVPHQGLVWFGCNAMPRFGGDVVTGYISVCL